MESPLYAGERKPPVRGIPFPPLTPHAGLPPGHGPHSQSPSSFSPARATAGQGSPGMRHATPANFPNRLQPPKQERHMGSTGNMHKFRAVLQASTKKEELSAEDRQEASIFEEPRQTQH